MKIIKTKLKGENIAAYTDEFPEMGFYIPIDSIEKGLDGIPNKTDLKKKVQERVDKEIAERNLEAERLKNYKYLEVKNA